MAPHFAGGTGSSLDFVDQQSHSVFFRNPLQVLPKIVSSNLVSKLHFTWKNSGEASLSPPSDWMGSTTIPATGTPFFWYFSINSSTSARHLASSAWFSLTFSSRGYLYLRYTLSNNAFIRLEGKQPWKVCYGPIKWGNVQFVDGFRVSGGQGCHSSTVESAMEWQKRQARAPRWLIDHTWSFF